MKRLILLVSMACMACMASCSHGDLRAGADNPLHPKLTPEVSHSAVVVHFSEAELVRHESSLWVRLGEEMFLPEFYESSEAPPGYLRVHIGWPGKWEAAMEFFVGCNHFAEPDDVAKLFDDMIWMVGKGHLNFGAFSEGGEFDELWFERSLEGALSAIHPVCPTGEFKVEYIILSYDLSWCDYRSVWHHYQYPCLK